MVLCACDGSRGKPETAQDPKLNELDGAVVDVDVEMHEGTNMAASPSPDGSTIVISLQGALWTLPAAGGTAKKITPWDVEATQPAWSPDGRLIAFQNYANGNYHVWLVAPDGSGLRELTTGPFDDREPSWFPDSTRIVFSSDRSDDRQYKIWSVTLNGTYTQITKGAGAEGNPMVSPDGTRVVFADSGTIFTMPLDSSAAPAPYNDGIVPAWTPDGGLAYQSGGKLVINGSAVTSGEDLFPFPLSYMKSGGFMYTANGKVRTRDAGGGNPKEVAFSATTRMRRPVFAAPRDRPSLGDPSLRVAQGISAPALSPDAKSIAFVALNDLWVMKIGETPVRLTQDVDREASPQWTRDGSAVYFSSDRANAGSFAVDRIDVSTQTRTRLAQITGVSIITPTLSPSEDRLAYTIGSGQLEIMEVASKTRTPIVAPAGFGPQVSRPTWSADGTKVMLVDNEQFNRRFREGYNRLRVVDIATKTPILYPVGPAPESVADREEGAAVWSPDGTKVAFIGDSVLKVMPTNADGSPAGPAVAITSTAADMPSWAADSRTLLYMASGKLRTINADGSGVRDVAVDIPWTPGGPAGITIIRAGALWTGVSETLLSDVDITITGNRITAIGPHQANAGALADTYLDASGLTVMPGLWEPHFHPSNVLVGGQFNQSWAALFAYGITSVQSVGGPVYSSTEIREALEAGNLVGPRLFTSSPLLEGNRSFYNFGRTVRSPEIADLEIDRYRSVNIDFIKSYVRAPIPVMARLAKAAHAMGIPSGTHLLTPGSAMGIGGLTHLQATQRMGYGFAKSPAGVPYQDVTAILGQADFHLTETMGTTGLDLVAQNPMLLTGERFDFLMPVPFVDSLKAMTPPTPGQLAAAKLFVDQDAKAVAAGALFALGTDSPFHPPGVTNHANLMALGLSLSNHQALQSVTINAAKVSYKDHELGSVEVGKLADLVIVQGNPLHDLKFAAATQYVVKNGVVYTLPQIVAPFKTPVQTAARRRALIAFNRTCKLNRDECRPYAAGH